MSLEREGSPVNPEEWSFGVHKDMPIDLSCAQARWALDPDDVDISDGIGPRNGTHRIPNRVFYAMRDRKSLPAASLYGALLYWAERDREYIVNRRPIGHAVEDAGLAGDPGNPDPVAYFIQELEDAGFIIPPHDDSPTYLLVDVLGGNVKAPEWWSGSDDGAFNLPTSMRQDGRLRDDDVRILGAMLYLGHAKPIIRIPNNLIASTTGLTVSQVRRGLDRIEEANYIARSCFNNYTHGTTDRLIRLRWLARPGYFVGLFGRKAVEW